MQGDVFLQIDIQFCAARVNEQWRRTACVRYSSGATPSVLKSGTRPKAANSAGDEYVILQFTVAAEATLENIRPLQGRDSISPPMLTSTLAKWKFAPALSGTTPVPARGKVLPVQGEDYFRFQVSSTN